MADQRSRQAEKWLERIQASRSVQEPHRKLWRRLRSLFVWGSDSEPRKRGRDIGLDSIRVNLAHSLVRASVARILAQNPYLLAYPRRPGDETGAAGATLALNYLVDEIGTLEQARLCLTDALVFGIGVMKLGFDSEYGIDSEEVVQRIEAGGALRVTAQQIDAVRTLAGLGPPGLRPKSENRREPLLEFNQLVIRENPWTLRVSPLDFFQDPAAKRLEECQWIAFRFRRPIEAIKADRRYTNDRLKLQGETLIDPHETVWDEQGDPTNPDNLRGGPGDSSTVRSIARAKPLAEGGPAKADPTGTLYEVWDRREDMVYVVSGELGAVLREERNPFEVEGFPCELLTFNDIPDRFWPKSDLQDIEAQQLEVNQIRQTMLQWMRRMAKFILLTPKGALEEIEKEKLTGPDPFLFLEFNPQFSDAVKEANLGTFNPDMYRIEEFLKRDIRDSFGYSEEQMGSPVQGITATASANAALSAETRMADKQRRVEVFYRQIARKLLQVVRQFWPPEVVFRVIGRDGASWQTVSAEDIRREYDVRVEVGSSTRPQDEVRRRQLVELTQVLAPVAQSGAVTIDWQEFLNQVLYAYGFPDPSRIVKPPPPLLMGADTAATGMGPAAGGLTPPGMGGPPVGEEASVGQGPAAMAGRFRSAVMQKLSQARVGT